MKILYVTNKPSKFEYDQCEKSGWNLLPSLFKRHGVNILAIGKHKLPKFYSIYLRFKPDIIVGEWVPAAFIPVLFKKLGLIKCPVILNWGDYYADMMTNYPRFLVKFLEDYSAKNATYITTVSKFNEKKANAFKTPVSYIPHGYFKDIKRTKVNLDKHKTKKANLKIIYLGEQSTWKKVDQVIHAVKGLDCDLFLFGTINKEFTKIAGKNVHFMGYVNELEVREVLKQADILVNTSNQDCSYKFQEYISVGKPILAYDGLPSNILTHKENAFLTKDFKEGLIELIKNKTLRSKLEENAKKLKAFTWNEIILKYIKLYNNLISNSQKIK